MEPSEIHAREELRNIVRSAPLSHGDTISPYTARDCKRRGWAAETEAGYVPTPTGLAEDARTTYPEPGEEAGDGEERRCPHCQRPITNPPNYCRGIACAAQEASDD